MAEERFATVRDIEAVSSVLAYVIGFLWRHPAIIDAEEKRLLEDIYKQFQKDMRQLGK